jgi:hypothetical protein
MKSSHRNEQLENWVEVEVHKIEDLTITKSDEIESQIHSEKSEIVRERKNECFELFCFNEAERETESELLNLVTQLEDWWRES